MKPPPHLTFLLGLGLALLALAGCATTRATLEAGGVYVRHQRLWVSPAQTQAFETLLRRCVEAASAAELGEESSWLCYREPPGRYWLLYFSETADGFATPPGLARLAEHVGGAQGSPARAEITAMLRALRVETEWELVFQQKALWSSVDSMSADTHPKARMMHYTIRPGMGAAFEAALGEQTTFLIEYGYPLPIEGFVLRSDWSQRALQVVFPVEWSTFYAHDSVSAFVLGLDEAAQDDHAARQATLMDNTARLEFFDGDFAPELSYRPADSPGVSPGLGR